MFGGECTATRFQRTTEVVWRFFPRQHAQGACASFLTDRPRKVLQPEGQPMSAWYIGVKLQSHCTAKSALINAEEPSRDGPGLVHPRSWSVKTLWLNPSAAVVRVKMPKPARLRARQGLHPEQQLGGVWWLGSSCRGTDTNSPLKLPSAHSDRGYAFPRKI
jgi:hypothetical protein